MNKQTGTDAAGAVERFMQCHREGQFAVDALDFIIDAAISAELKQARVGTHILFGHVVEPLSDTFLKQDREALNRVLAHLISRIRILPQARPIHERLDRWGLRDESDLLNRMKRLSAVKPFDSGSRGKVKKIFIPSRITLGADVLLNSMVIEKMIERFPDAEIVFLGNGKNGSLLKGNQPQVRVHSLQYDRRDVLLNRFLKWLDVIRALESETCDPGPEVDYIIVNTDSRLLQSGLLPLLSPGKEDGRYFFWEPSIRREAWGGTSQAEDLAQWLRATFGTEPRGRRDEKIYPKIDLLPQDNAFAKQVYEILDPAGKAFVVGMSLGVGGNQEKRVRYSSEIVSRFEKSLVRKLLSDGVILVLDRGEGVEEYEQADALIQTVRDMGFETAEVTEESPGLIGVGRSEANPRDIRLLVYRGGVSKFAALISLSDLYIGYDSLGQHAAAALGRDVIAIFAGYHSDLFPERWKPLGSGTIRLVKACSGPFSPGRQDELAAEVFELYKRGLIK
jgi:ADP-heptose:LPS heptosyltransferase